MKNRDRIPHISHYSVYLYKVKCNNMVKYYQKESKTLMLSIRQEYGTAALSFFIFMFKYYPLIIFLTSAV